MLIDFSKFEYKTQQPKTEFEGKVLYFINDWFSESKTVNVQTSGSTGAPKIFEIEKEKMRFSAKTTCAFLHLKVGETALLCLPIEYISGKMMVVRAAEKKLKLRVAEPSAKPLEHLSEKIDFCAMTPLQVENSLGKLHLIRNLIIGGAAVSEHLKSEIRNLKSEIPNLKIYETYGMSETLSHIALKEIFPKDEEFFTIFEGIKISTDARNCLKINAPKLCPEILQTNDIVELIGENRFRFLGRWDNAVNSGGVKIFPEILEKELKKYVPNELVFLGMPDEILGQKLVLAVENGKAKTPNLKAEISKLKTQIPNLKYLKQTFFLKKFPRSANGKILRKEIFSSVSKMV